MKIKVIPYNTLEYASLDAFPATGESGKHYLALDTMLLYTWNSVTSLYVSADFRYEGKPTYHGSYLKSGYLEFTMVASPTPIDWHIGDYIRYDRTGRVYRLYSIPQVERQATTNHTGESFAYRNVQLYDKTKDWSLVPFRDLVPGVGGTGYYFSSKQDITFTGTVANVVERLNANLDAFFGEGVWNVRIAENIPESYEVTVAKEFSVSGMCIDVLNAIYETWHELGWAYFIENGVDTIVIGYPNIAPATSGNRTNVFSYDNGLTALKRNNGGLENFCTRLHVYGTERNLINRYYNGKDIYNAESVFIPNLMIPVELWGQTDNKPDASKAYIEDADKIALYGLITKDIYFDGTDGRPEIYPSVEQQTIEILKAAKTSLGKTGVGAPDYYPQEEDDTIRVDQIKAAVQIPQDVGTPTNSGEKYIDTFDATINTTIVNAQSVSNRQVGEVQLFEYTFVDNGVVDIKWNGALRCVLDQALAEGDYITLSLCVYDGTPSRTSLVSSADFVVESNLNNGQILNLDNVLSIGSKTNQVTGHYVVTLRYAVILANSGSRTITITKEGDILASANIREALVSNFKIKTHQIGFDIAKMQSSGGATLSFKSGMCAGRDFSILKAVYNSNDDDWTLTCRRSQDTSTQTYYPNASFAIATDDEFVILGITMPEEYILAQAHRLYALGQELFERISVFRPTFEPSVDSKKVLENITQHPSDPQYKLIEGKYMRLYDEELIGGDHNTDVLISEITINEGEAEIATYHVVLSDRASVTGGLPRTVAKLSTEMEKIQESQRQQTALRENATQSDTPVTYNEGSDVNPVYFKDGIPRVIDGLEVPENIRTQKNVEAGGGVSAGGMVSLNQFGTGGGTVNGIKFDPNVAYQENHEYLSDGEDVTLPAYPSLAGYATENYVATYFGANFTQVNIKNTLGISDWALAANKPSYAFSEIGSKPTTIAGYGITDAHITSGVITLGANTITPATLSNGKIPLSQLPDAILGQMIYGGTVNGSGVVTLSQNAKDKWGITSLTLTSTNYADYEGAFFIASADGSSGVPSALGVLVGDWIVATASNWGKIDNTDAVTGIKFATGDIRIGQVDLTTWLGSSSITTLGTITTGVWHGTAIGDSYISSATTWNAKYDKPSGGIPATDLATAVQTSLGKADTALQSHQTIYDLIIKKNGTQVGNTYNPATGAQTINITDVASASDLESAVSILSSAIGTVDGKADDNAANIILHDGRIADLESYFDGGIANNAARLSNTSKIGDTNKPVYFTANGVPAAISYEINKSVPSNALFTDQNVSQTATTSNAAYEILFSGSANNTTATEGARKTNTLTYNPSTKELTTGGDIVLAGFIDSTTTDYAGLRFFRSPYGNSNIGGVTQNGVYFGHTLSGYTDAEMSLKAGSGLSLNTNVMAAGGVSAGGMVDLSLAAGGGGSGTLTQIKINGTALPDVDGVVNIPIADTTQAGAMSTSDRAKLTGIADGANASNVAWSTNKLTKTINGVTSDVFGISDVATALTTAGYKLTDTWTAWAGATSSAAGTAGYMPAPTSAQRNQFLRGDGSWVDLNNYSLPLAASGTRGGVQIGYTTDATNRNYAVQLSSEKMYVNVPWTDTTYESKAAASGGTAVSLVTTGEKYDWNTAYGWGDHSQAGYFAASSFTQANIKSTLGISDWALAASKPSYAYSEITDTPTLATVATSGSYNDLSDTPTIPTVNNGNLYLQASGTTKVTFTANQSGNSTFNIATGSINGTLSIGGTDVSVKGLGLSAYTGYDTVVTKDSDKLITSGAVWTAIDNLPEPMVFKGSLGTGGTITTLPVDGSASIGDTYKVITAGTYASKDAKEGDTFICLTKTSSANTWELIPSGDEPSGTVTSITLKAGTGISLDIDNTAITTSGTRTITNAGVRAATINGNYLRINTNGTNADLAIPYATKANGIRTYDGVRNTADNVKALNDSNLHYFIEGSGWRMIHMSWSDSGYDTQIAIPDHVYDGNHIKWRSLGDSASHSSYESWMTLLDSSNYTSYTVTKTGTGASGTWGINVSGSAASCTGNAATATDADLLDGHHFSEIETSVQELASAIGNVNAKADDNTLNIGLHDTRIGDLESYFDAGIAKNALRLSNTSAIGTTTKPVYFTANGVPAECSSYAGGTAVTLNGTSKAASTASFYAPTGAGTSGQILKSTAGAPEWINQSAITAGKATILETTRTLWGQDFNGSANVSGDMSNVGSISANGFIDISHTDFRALRVSRSPYGSSNIGGVDSGGVYFGHTLSGYTDAEMRLKASTGLTVNQNIQAGGGISAGGMVDLSVIAGQAQYVTSMGFGNNALTWALGGEAQTPITIGYATYAASAGAVAWANVSGKPEIPTDSTVSGWGYQKAMTIYSTGTTSTYTLRTDAQPTFDSINNSSTITISLPTLNDSTPLGVIHTLRINRGSGSSITVNLPKSSGNTLMVVRPANSITVNSSTTTYLRYFYSRVYVSALSTYQYQVHFIDYQHDFISSAD